MYRIKSNSQHPSSRNQGWSGKKVKSKTCHIPTIFDLGKGGAGGLNFLSILSKMVYTKSLLGFWVSLFELMTMCIYRTHSSVFMVFTTGTLPIKMIWYPLLAKDTGMTQTWSVRSHCSAYFLSDRESANAESRPQSLCFLCPLELDGNRFQWKPKGILASGNARLVSASSDFLKTGMVRIHTSPPSSSYSLYIWQVILTNVWRLLHTYPDMFENGDFFLVFEKIVYTLGVFE